MGLFGRKKKAAKEAQEAGDDAVKDEALEVARETGQDAERDAALAARETDDAGQDDGAVEVSMEYEGRGIDVGPWDVDDEAVPDYDEYLSLGSYYLPFLKETTFRVKASRASHEVLGTTMTLGSSSVEVEAFAAPKTMGLWDDVRADLLEANPSATEVAGVFGAEVMLPVKVKSGNTVMTRIVGVDGPRWMLRGIFSGNAASDPDSDEAAKLNDFFADIVVERGDEPLAPRDLIPMHAPKTPAERKAEAAAASGQPQEGGKAQAPSRPEGPLTPEHETETKTTLSRGPMFSEVR